MEASTATRPDVLAPTRPGGVRSQRLLRLASDERLVSLVRAGNQAAFETVYDRHHRPLLSFCRHMLADRDESEDAVQHTFIAAYDDLVGSDKDIQLRPWLYAIARNRCLTMLRARRERPMGDEMEEVATEGLADEVQRRSDLQQLLGDLRELPEDQRAALVLAEVGALSHDEIAEIVGVPRAKVKALVFQARTSLISSRDARDMSCQTVREELSTARGGVLRRGPLRRHLAMCEGCTEFKDQVKHQRAAFAIVLPVVPTLGLKHGALPAAFGAGAGGGGAAGIAATGGGVAFFGSKGLAAKLLLGAAIAGSGAAGTAAVVEVATGPAREDSRALQVSSATAGAKAGTPAATGQTLLGVTERQAAARGRVVAAGSARRHAAAPGHHGSRHTTSSHRALRHYSPHRSRAGATTTTGATSPGAASLTPPAGAHVNRGHHPHFKKPKKTKHHSGTATRPGASGTAPGHTRPHPRGRSNTAPGHLKALGGPHPAHPPHPGKPKLPKLAPSS